MFGTSLWLVKGSNRSQAQLTEEQRVALQVQDYWTNYDAAQSLAPELVPRAQYDAVLMIQRSVRLWLNIRLCIRKMKEQEEADKIEKSDDVFVSKQSQEANLSQTTPSDGACLEDGLDLVGSVGET